MLKLAPSGERLAAATAPITAAPQFDVRAPFCVLLSVCVSYAIGQLEQDEELRRVFGSLVRKLNRVEESSLHLLPLLHETAAIKDRLLGVLAEVAPESDVAFM
jgi:hypothetical protein